MISCSDVKSKYFQSDKHAVKRTNLIRLIILICISNKLLNVLRKLSIFSVQENQESCKQNYLPAKHHFPVILATKTKATMMIKTATPTTMPIIAAMSKPFEIAASDELMRTV